MITKKVGDQLQTPLNSFSRTIEHMRRDNTEAGMFNTELRNRFYFPTGKHNKVDFSITVINRRYFSAERDFERDFAHLSSMKPAGTGLDRDNMSILEAAVKKRK